ncbi:hypothetical protein [Streptomyces sp. NPDC026673]|uniref:hypothetical protein n=1 Tax=Streptomyces sp. NPDC026673 TaxID=3155724 RepID=UPI0033FF222B
MRDSRAHDDRIDAALAERLLAVDLTADPADPAADGDGRTEALVRLLTAAAAPLPGDPERERAALAAFRAARGATHDGRRVRRARGARRTRTVLGGLVAVFVLGGVAVAAQSGTLPGPFRPGAAGPRPVSPPSSAPAGPVGTRTAAPRGPQGSTATPPAAPAVPRGPRDSVPPLAAPADAGLKGLCQTYAKASEHHKGVNAATLARLERAAGGTAAVSAYCAGLIGSPETTPPVRPEPAEGGRRR